MLPSVRRGESRAAGREYNETWKGHEALELTASEGTVELVRCSSSPYSSPGPSPRSPPVAVNYINGFQAGYEAGYAMGHASGTASTSLAYARPQLQQAARYMRPITKKRRDVRHDSSAGGPFRWAFGESSSRYSSLAGSVRVIHNSRSNGPASGGVTLKMSDDFKSLPTMPDHGLNHNVGADALTWHDSVTRSVTPAVSTALGRPKASPRLTPLPKSPRSPTSLLPSPRDHAAAPASHGASPRDHAKEQQQQHAGRGERQMAGGGGERLVGGGERLAGGGELLIIDEQPQESSAEGAHGGMQGDVQGDVQGGVQGGSVQWGMQSGVDAPPNSRLGTAEGVGVGSYADHRPITGAHAEHRPLTGVHAGAHAEHRPLTGATAEHRPLTGAANSEHRPLTTSTRPNTMSRRPNAAITISANTAAEQQQDPSLMSAADAEAYAMAAAVTPTDELPAWMKGIRYGGRPGGWLGPAAPMVYGQSRELTPVAGAHRPSTGMAQLPPPPGTRPATSFNTQASPREQGATGSTFFSWSSRAQTPAPPLSPRPFSQKLVARPGSIAESARRTDATVVIAGAPGFPAPIA